MGRSKDKHGRNSYGGEGLSLASFRESSELEFGADDAFILTPRDVPGGDTVVLRHLKSRHGEAKDLPMAFDPRVQKFTANSVTPTGGKSKFDTAALAALWARAAVAEGSIDREQEEEGWAND